MVLAMSEEQLKAAETEATAEQEEEFGEEISEDDLEGVAGGGVFVSPQSPVTYVPNSEVFG